MSDLIVVAYDDELKAEEVRLKMLRMQQEYLVELEDAVVVLHKRDGQVKLLQLMDLTKAGAISGGFWGTLIGMLFLSPLIGLAAGATCGAISGALTDVGINDDFMEELGDSLPPGSSALCVLLKKFTADKVMDELSGSGGKILKTSLSHEDEERLQTALAEAKIATDDNS